MLINTMAVEMSKQNFVTKFNHVSTLLGVCTTFPCVMSYSSPVPGGAIGQSLNGHQAGPEN